MKHIKEFPPPTEFFGTVRQKLFDGKPWYSPRSYPNFVGTRNYCNSKGFPHGNFRHCETKIFRRKILTLPPPLIPTFSVPEIFATVKDSPPLRKFSALWDKKISTENLDTLPPLSYSNFFDTRSYCNSKAFPYGNFRHCETKIFRRKILILPPPILFKFFGTRN